MCMVGNMFTGLSEAIPKVFKDLGSLSEQWASPERLAGSVGNERISFDIVKKISTP